MFFECEDLQARLKAALSLKHEIQFYHIICDLKINPNTPQECFGDLSIFEKVLATPQRSKFIELCLKSGAEFFTKNAENQFPLYYAVSSMCPENVKSLFACISSGEILDSEFKEILFSNIVNEKLANSDNYLHKLVSAMNENNFEDVAKIVKVFVVNGCSMNTPNDHLETPFYLLLKKMQTIPVSNELVQFILNNQKIDFFLNNSNEVVEMMEEQGLGHKIDERLVKIIDSEYMLRLQDDRNEKKFIEELSSYQNLMQSADQYEEGIAKFLKAASELNLCQVIEALVERGADVNLIVNGAYPPAFIACMFGHYAVLELLLAASSLKLRWAAANMNLLHQICMTEDIHELDRQRCFSLIVNDHRCTKNVVNGLDKNGNSPLNYACSNGLRNIAENLLNRGAFIGHPSVVDKMEKETLEKFLDSCIRPSTDLSNIKCEIHIDYRFLMPPQNDKNIKCEVESLQKIAESDELHDLVLHPVISSFLQLKWRKIKWIAFFNVFMYLCFMLYLGYFILNYFDSNEFKNSITKENLNNQTKHCNISDHLTYLHSRFLPPVTSVNATTMKKAKKEDDFAKFLSAAAKFSVVRKRSVTFPPDIKKNEPTAESTHNNTSEPSTETIVVKLLEENPLPFRICVIGSAALALYELMQCILSPRKYLFKLSNWLDLALIYLSLAVLLVNPFCIDPETFKIYKALTILVMSAQTVQLIAKVSIFSMSIHMAIFKKVFMTFVKTISLYMLPILAFAMSFYTLNDDQRIDLDLTIAANQTPSDSGDTRPFSGIYMSIITTIRMMMSDIGVFTVKKENTFQNSILLLFIVLVSIVLFNLLNALAISDTEKIMKDAELVDIKKRISLLYSYEKMFQYCGIDFSNVFPNLKSLVLKPNVDRARKTTQVKHGDEKVEKIEKAVLKFLVSLFADSSTYSSMFHQPSQSKDNESRLNASGYTIRKSDFDKIVSFVKNKLQ